MGRMLKGAVMAVALATAAPAPAQQTGNIPTTVLTIESERLFLNSDFGERVARELEARGRELATENRQIEAALAAEEQNLTDRRATMSPEEFRPLADAFDERVVQTRAAQAEKSRDLNAAFEREREAFLTAAGPILQAIMQEAGATVILERRDVFISTNSADITAAAVDRLNAEMGDGSAAAD